jgi:hypothetical protein
VLPALASERAGEGARLERGDADVAVVLGAPRRLVALDQETKLAVVKLVARSGALAAAPVRQVVREPAALVER